MIAFSLIAGPFAALGIRLATLGEFVGVGGDPIPSLHGPILDDSLGFKLDETRSRRPALLAIGSSQIRDLRSSVFSGCDAKTACFYNATNTATTTHAELEFLRRSVTSSAPKVLLLAVDWWQFDPSWVPDKHERSETLLADPASRLNYAWTVTQRVGRFSFVSTEAELQLPGPEVRRALLGIAPAPRDVRGLRALLSGAGYRPDGSYARGPADLAASMKQTSAERTADGARRIAIRDIPYAPFAHADERSLAEVSAILDLADTYGIHVIPFMTPMSDETAAQIDQVEGLASGISDVERRLLALFSARGVPFRLGRSLTAAGCRPDEHWNEDHPTEPCMARIVRQLLADPVAGKLLAPYASLDALDRLLAQRVSTFSLQGDP